MYTYKEIREKKQKDKENRMFAASMGASIDQLHVNGKLEPSAYEDIVREYICLSLVRSG